MKIESEGKFNIAGYDPRFLVVISIIDYIYFYANDTLLSWYVAKLLFDSLPDWIAFVPASALLVGGALLGLCGPLALVLIIKEGWEKMND